MKSFITISATLLLFILFSCRQKKEDKSFIVFNEGVTLNLKSISEQEKGNFESASKLNKQSIDKFKETLKIDSSHPGARISLGHALYVDGQFEEAISWFNQANKVDGTTAINLREMGLCKINLGHINEGKSDIDKAFSIDTKKEIKEITIQDLVDIGDLAFSYGDGYIKQGEVDKGKDYKIFSIEVLRLAFGYDSTKKENALKIVEYADKFGDKLTSNKYKLLAGR